MMKKIAAVSGIAMAGLLLAGCGSTNGASQANIQEQSTQAAIQTGALAKQPIPVFDYSQQRQTLIAVESAQAHGVATTSFFYNQGIKDPIFVCPSLGFPIPSTASLTNPQQAIWTNGPNSNYSSDVIGQMEPTGIYVGDSSGTYVECVAPNGTQYAKYWEGFVDTIGGPASWNGSTEVLDGAPTVVTKK